MTADPMRGMRHILRLLVAVPVRHRLHQLVVEMITIALLGNVLCLAQQPLAQCQLGIILITAVAHRRPQQGIKTILLVWPMTVRHHLDPIGTSCTIRHREQILISSTGDAPRALLRGMGPLSTRTGKMAMHLCLMERRRLLVHLVVQETIPLPAIATLSNQFLTDVLEISRSCSSPSRTVTM